VGRGDAHPGWTYETVESISTTIEGISRPALRRRPVWDLDGAGRRSRRVINRGLSIGVADRQIALDLALHDLIGHALGLPIGILWVSAGATPSSLAGSCPARPATRWQRSVEEGQCGGYQAFKVKVVCMTR